MRWGGYPCGLLSFFPRSLRSVTYYNSPRNQCSRRQPYFPDWSSEGLGLTVVGFLHEAQAGKEGKKILERGDGGFLLFLSRLVLDLSSLPVLRCISMLGEGGRGDL